MEIWTTQDILKETGMSQRQFYRLKKQKDSLIPQPDNPPTFVNNWWYDKTIQPFLKKWKEKNANNI